MLNISFSGTAKGHSFNSGEHAVYEKGKCSDPQGRLTLMCGKELELADHEMNDHDCQIDQADKTKATCSSVADPSVQ